jgi:DNA-binding transcriptional regulator GbsR (MarR family)
LEFIETCGRFCHLLGLPRSTGQIYGFLYLSVKPASLDEIADALSISKASASTGTRQLVGLHAVRQVWILGERKDHFEVQIDLREVLRTNYAELFKPRFEKSGRKLEGIQAALNADFEAGLIDEEAYNLCRERFENIAGLQRRVRRILPLAEKFL